MQRFCDREPFAPTFFVNLQATGADLLRDCRALLSTTPVSSGLFPGIQCQQCERTFQSMGALTSHVRRDHAGTSSYSTTLEDMQVQRALHSVNGLPICTHRGRRFARWQQFLQHISRSLCPALHDHAAHVNMLYPAPMPSTVPSVDPAVSETVLQVMTGGPRTLHALSQTCDRLTRHCVFCSQWLASSRLMKAHIRRSHGIFGYA